MRERWATRKAGLFDLKDRAATSHDHPRASGDHLHTTSPAIERGCDTALAGPSVVNIFPSRPPSRLDPLSLSCSGCCCKRKELLLWQSKKETQNNYLIDIMKNTMSSSASETVSGPGAIRDSTDRAQIQELIINSRDRRIRSK